MADNNRSQHQGSTSLLRDRSFWVAVISGVLLCGAFAPLKLWFLALLAPTGWVYLIRHSSIATHSTRQKFLRLYLAGFVHWMLLIQWIRLPHPAAFFGWFLLAAYLAIYLPLFVFSSRYMIDRWRVPAIIAIPVVWTGLEFARSFLFTGFSISLLGHAFVALPEWIQIADLAGAYAVSFVAMTVAVCIERLYVQFHNASAFRGTLFTALWGIAIVVATFTYGQSQRADRTDAVSSTNGTVRVALIQAVYDTEFDHDLEVAQQRAYQAFDDYYRLSLQAIQNNRVDLVVWPESMFSTGWRHGSYPTIIGKLDDRPDYDMTADEWKVWLNSCKEVSDDSFVQVASKLDAALLVGLSRMEAFADTEHRFNSAFYIDRSGKLSSQYDKMHPVMFGEYVPFAKFFPWVYRLTPMSGGLTPGMKPSCMEMNGVRFSPCICFENTVPQLIRKQVNELARSGHEPDCLLTVTNDGWFWGSSLLDAHLACAVFRAIENRKPMLIAANTGFSASIDASGIILQQGPRRKEGIVVAEATQHRTVTVYRKIGDWPVGVLLVVSLAACTGSYFNRRSCETTSC